jgi:hypothetical protein
MERQRPIALLCLTCLAFASGKIGLNTNSSLSATSAPWGHDVGSEHGIANPFDSIHSAQPGRARRLSPELSKTHIDTGVVIDGAETPDLIDDALAFRMFLRMLLPRDGSASAQIAHRSYIKHIVRQAKHESSDAFGGDSRPRESEIDSMMRFVSSYSGRLKAFDAARKDLSGGSQLAAEIVATMPYHVGNDLSRSVQLYVTRHFKAKIKVLK